MAKADTVYSLFGMKSPQQVAREQMLSSQKLLQSQTDPYARLGTALGMGLGRMFGGANKEMATAIAGDKAYKETTSKLSDFEKEAEAEAESRGLPKLTEPQILDRKASDLELLADKFLQAGQPSNVVENMKNQALQLRMTAAQKQRELVEFDQKTQKFDMDMQVGQARLDDLSKKGKLTSKDLAELQLKSTPESYQAWLQGTGTLVPNPRALSNPQIPDAIEIWEYMQNLPSDEARQEFLLSTRSAGAYIKDAGNALVFMNPLNPSQEVGRIQKGLPPQDEPAVRGQQEAAKTAGRELTESQLNAGGQLDSLNRFTKIVNDVRKHPGKERGTGWGAKTPDITPQASAFTKKVQQLKDNAFLNQIPILKGMGALSNAEGDALRASFSYIDQVLPTAEFDAELTNIQNIIGTIENRIKNKQFLTVEEVLQRPYRGDGATQARNGVRTGTTSSGVPYTVEEE